MSNPAAAFEDAHPGLLDRWLASGDRTLIRLARTVETRGWVTDLDLISAAKTLARIDARAAVATAVAAGDYVGTVGQPITLTVTIDRLLRFAYTRTPGHPPVTSYVHLMHAGDHAVVYRGSVVLGDEGDTVTIAATVRAHEVRDGIRQTLIQRPRRRYPTP